ncbi:Flp pilus assembly protein RcpC/CpaB domain-containing protein OS=Streptomyces aurantiogriseus OX=66870 GN=GCM10010251_21480 PE=4 SV=1 [Streptomyces aurantiogriseus]|nr:RcpC/CpaB family pilus assembly protein [Streptomyces aurantiogriseus]
MPLFAPVRVRGGRCRLRRLVHSRRRALALALAVTAAALVAAGPEDAGASRGHPDGGAHARAQAPTGDPVRRRPTTDTAEAVEAPVRIADAAAVRLLRPGDRVDVIAAEQTAAGGEARVVARRALVTKVPEPLDGAAGAAGPAAGDVVDGGALVVLSVPPPTAARLAGASATARLAVTLW